MDDDTFRFPIRAARPPVALPAEADSDGSDDGEAEGTEGGGGLTYAPPWDTLPSSWAYKPAERALFHAQAGKRIALRHLDSTQKVTRLIIALNQRPDMDVEGLIAALQEASQACYQADLMTVLTAHAGDRPLLWGATADDPEPAPKRRVRLGG